VAIVSIHQPLRMVSGSVTAIQRSTTVEHTLDGSVWQVRWFRAEDGRSRERGAPTGELHVRTLCGKELDGLPWTPQKREPCKLCEKAGRELRTTVLLHPPFWEETRAAYIDEQLNKYKRPPKPNDRPQIAFEVASQMPLFSPSNT
jgi:hypothetical protein